MPRLSRWFLKIGLLYLIGSLLLQVGILLPERTGLSQIFLPFKPTFFHLFMVGWITEIIIGVSYWMFPGRKAQEGTYWETIGWGIWVLLNVGLLLRFLAEPLLILDPQAIWKWLLVLSAIFQWLGGMGYVLLIWNRVQGK